MMELPNSNKIWLCYDYFVVENMVSMGTVNNAEHVLIYV